MAILPSSPSLETSFAISFLLSCSRQVAVLRKRSEVLERSTCNCAHVMQPRFHHCSKLGCAVAQLNTITAA